MTYSCFKDATGDWICNQSGGRQGRPQSTRNDRFRIASLFPGENTLTHLDPRHWWDWFVFVFFRGVL